MGDTYQIHVLAVNYWLYPGGYSGATMQAISLGKELARQGLRITFASAGQRDEYLESAEHTGLAFRRLRVAYPGGGTRLGRQLMFGMRVAQLLLSRTFDILHLHGFSSSGPIALLAAKSLGIPSVAKLASLGMDDPLTIRYRRSLGQLRFQALSLADRIICPSRGLAEAYLRSGLPHEKMQQIVNGVDLVRFRPLEENGGKSNLKQRLGLGPDNVVAIFVGPLTPGKKVDVLVRSWPEVIGKYPNVRLVLVGPSASDLDMGRKNEEFALWLKGQIGRPDMRDSIFPVGMVENVEEYLQAADLFVFPSGKEGLPNALLEAMSCGLPCIARRIPGVTDFIITNGLDGLFVEEGEDEWGEIICRLIGEGALRSKLGSEARETIRRRFSITQVAGEYVALYRSLLA